MHLVDSVLGGLPIRQWVLTCPWRLRYAMAWDHRLCRAVLAVFIRAVLGLQRRRARRRGLRGGVGGSVTAIQRSGAALNLNVHFHGLVADGTFVPAGDHRRLEGLVRYVLRPPVARDALEILPDGTVCLALRRPWRDGTCAILFTPTELIEKLAALVPRPRIHLLIYHGAFAPHARIRRDAVAGARAAAGVAPVTTATAGPAPGGLAAAETATMWYPPGSWTVQAAKRSLYSFGVR